MDLTRLFDRRMLLKAGSVLGGLSAVFGRPPAADAQARNDSLLSEAPSDGARMADVPFNSNAKVTVERRGQIVLIGINRPYIHNRIDHRIGSGLLPV